MQLIIRRVCCSVAEASAATVRESNPLGRREARPGDVSEDPDTDFLRGRFRCGPESAVCCSVAEASAATLREMNPLVRIEALPGDVSEEPDTDFLRDFDVVLLPQAPLCMQLAYDKACTEINTAFFTACSRGTVAYFFENLHVHEHTPMVKHLHALRLHAWTTKSFH